MPTAPPPPPPPPIKYRVSRKPTFDSPQPSTKPVSHSQRLFTPKPKITLFPEGIPSTCTLTPLLLQTPSAWKSAESRLSLEGTRLLPQLRTSFLSQLQQQMPSWSSIVPGTSNVRAQTTQPAANATNSMTSSSAATSSTSRHLPSIRQTSTGNTPLLSERETKRKAHETSPCTNEYTDLGSIEKPPRRRYTASVSSVTSSMTSSMPSDDVVDAEVPSKFARSTSFRLSNTRLRQKKMDRMTKSYSFQGGSSSGSDTPPSSPV